jgi:hypothetical protein
MGCTKDALDAPAAAPAGQAVPDPRFKEVTRK